MTLTVSLTKTTGLACNGVTVAFNSTFKAYDSADVKVYKVLTSTGVETLLSLVADSAGVDEYTIGALTGSTFTITAGTAYASTFTIAMKRELALTQTRSFTNQRSYRGETHELAYDELTMMMQSLDETIARSLKFPVSSAFTGVEVPVLTDNAELFMKVNAAETGVEWAQPADFTASLPLAVANGGTGGTTPAAAKTNLGISAFQHNAVATTAPGVGDDSDDGYEVGSRWINVTTDRHYSALDVTVGAAVWIETLQTDQALAFSGTHTHTALALFTEQNDTITTNAITFDFSAGNTCKVTLDDDVTGVTLSGAAAGAALQIRITQDSTPRTVAGWPAAVKWWNGGVAPVISTTAASVDIIYLFFDGTNYFASFVQDHR